jgi:predicted lipoprotein with Yx(FWY)xxD motif
MRNVTALPVLTAGVLLLLAACGSSTSDTSSTSTPSATSSSSASSSPFSSSSSTSSSPAAQPATPAAAATVTTGMATVSGKSETVLTDLTGHPLYYRTSDTSTKVTCGPPDCAGTWPPIMAPASGSPTSATPLPGTLTVFNGVNGNQVLYNGHPLYTFRPDAPGKAGGQGVGGFFVVTPGLSASM